MTYEQLKDLKPGACKRACGVHRQTFEHMLQVLRAHEQLEGQTRTASHTLA
jgi:hypothetical protein